MTMRAKMLVATASLCTLAILWTIVLFDSRTRVDCMDQRPMMQTGTLTEGHVNRPGDACHWCRAVERESLENKERTRTSTCESPPGRTPQGAGRKE